MVEVEEEDHNDADQVDCKVERHPDESRKDELVSGLGDAKDEEAARDDRDDRDEDVNAFQPELDLVDLLWLLHRPAGPGISVVIVLEIDLLQSCTCIAVQALRVYNKTAKEEGNVEQVENDRDNCNGEAACPKLERRTMLLALYLIPPGLNTCGNCNTLPSWLFN